MKNKAKPQNHQSKENHANNSVKLRLEPDKLHTDVNVKVQIKNKGKVDFLTRRRNVLRK